MKYPILIIIPSLNRPKSTPQCIESFTTNGNGMADYIVLERRPEPGMQATLNSLARVPELLNQYEIVAIINDDVRMRTKDWDKIIYAKLNGKTGMVYGADGIQNERLATQPFMSAHVPVDIGLLGPPAPFRNLNDIFWWEIFHSIKRVEYVPQIYTEHLHHCVGKGIIDDTYRGNDAQFAADSARWGAFRVMELPKLIAKIKVV